MSVVLRNLLMADPHSHNTSPEIWQHPESQELKYEDIPLARKTQQIHIDRIL